MSTNPLEALLANDPNVAPAFKRLFANKPASVLDTAHDKAQPRRFQEDATVSAFAPLSVERRREIRDEEEQCERDDAWQRDNHPPTDEEHGIDWSAE